MAKRYKISVEMVFDDVSPDDEQPTTTMLQELFKECYHLAFDDGDNIKYHRDLTKVDVEEVPRPPDGEETFE